ncbi:hypothetical protein [Amycolatopsis camponoti]|uniref:hypothetical protein n=1 Tax=Amycolatopsis camponoti TaxID=2606593 RepID=UPI0012D7AC65|nr:hypothetical protein [Amycolatopsis camponoti]
MIACEGVDCKSALKYWHLQWRRYRAEAKAENRARGMRVGTTVAVLMTEWLRRILATVLTIGVCTATAFLVAGGGAPPVPQPGLAAGCESVEKELVAVQVQPGRQDGSPHDDRSQRRQRQAEILKQVGCVVDFDERTSSPGLVTAGSRVSRRSS